MSERSQNLPAGASATGKISILLVSPDVEDENTLRRILNASTASVACCRSAADACVQVQSYSVTAVICERDLPDGNWRTVLAQCESSSPRPALLVTSRHADDSLWAEVLNLGGYDVLLKPFDPVEVARVVGMCTGGYIPDNPHSAAAGGHRKSASSVSCGACAFPCAIQGFSEPVDHLLPVGA